MRLKDQQNSIDINIWNLLRPHRNVFKIFIAWCSNIEGSFLLTRVTYIIELAKVLDFLRHCTN